MRRPSWPSLSKRKWNGTLRTGLCGTTVTFDSLRQYKQHEAIATIIRRAQFAGVSGGLLEKKDPAADTQPGGYTSRGLNAPSTGRYVDATRDGTRRGSGFVGPGHREGDRGRGHHAGGHPSLAHPTSPGQRNPNAAATAMAAFDGGPTPFLRNPLGASPRVPVGGLGKGGAQGPGGACLKKSVARV